MKRRAAKVAHLTSVHGPRDTRIFYRQCKTLAQAGYEVVLIAPAARDCFSDGVRLLAVPPPRRRSARMTSTIRHVYRAALAEHASVYHIHDPELLPLALLLKLKTRAKVVYDAHEDLPLTVAGKHWLPRRARPLVAGLCRVAELACASRLDAVVTVTTAIATKFPRHKTVVVQNFAPPDELFSDAAMPYPQRPPLFAYVGWISKLRGAVEMVQAINRVEPELGATLTMAGTISPPSLQVELAALDRAGRAELIGWQDRRGVSELLSRARAGLILLHPAQQYMAAQPVKLFEYMAAGIPVIVSDFPLWRRMVEEAGCGLLVDPCSPAAIAEAIAWLLRHPAEAEAMGRRGRAAMLRDYSWRSEAAKLLALYERLTA